MRRVSFVLPLLLALMTAPLLADDVSVEERLKRLETQVEELKKENEQLRKDLGLQATAQQADVKAGGKESRLQLGGYIQGQGEAGDRVDSRFSDDNDRMYVRRARVSVTGKFKENVDFKVETDFAGSLSNSSGMRGQLTDMYFNWTKYPLANLRFGQMKTPFGFEQLYADPRLAAAERSLASDRLTLSRQLGIQVSGDLVPQKLSYAVGAFNGTGINVNSNDNDRFVWVGRLSGSPFTTKASFGDVALHVGANAFTTRDSSVSVPADFGLDSTPSSSAKDSVFSGKRTGAGIDAQLTLGRAEVWGEYLDTKWKPTDSIPAHEFTSRGWYGQATYDVIRDRFQLVSRYESFDPSNSATGDDTGTWTLGTNWFIKSHDIKLQLNYLRSDSPLSNSNGRVIARIQTVF